MIWRGLRLTCALLAVGFYAGTVGSCTREAMAGKQAVVGKVSYLKGDALRSKGDDWIKLTQNASLYEGDSLKTGDGSRLEALLTDGSRLRLGSNSELKLENMKLSKKSKRRRKVRARLFLGRVWAAVSSWWGGGGKANFEVTTNNAVAGVRGTRFGAQVDEDGTTTVKVYSGKVLVSNKPIYAIKGHTKANRVEVAGPQEVSKKQWESLVAGAMQMIQVASNGEMAPAKGFELASAGDDDWEAWNAERDKAAGLHK